MLHSSLILRPTCSFSPARTPHSPSPAAPLNFPTSQHDNLRYLKSIGIITKTKTPSLENLHRILSTVNFLKSHGFSDTHFPRLAYHTPHIFSPAFEPAELQPVFDFLTSEVAATKEESSSLIHFCPKILNSHVQLCLKPTLHYLKQIGVQKLNAPTKLNAHLLNTRTQKLEEKVRFLQAVGLSRDEAAAVCARFPAVFGYSVERNLRPKAEYLVGGMGRGIWEVNGFPQYFAFSLENRIMPRHVHLKKRGVRIELQRMLVYSDEKFYAKWK